MARIPIQPVESATGPTKAVFDHLQKALGVVPNMTRVMANSPAVLQAYANFSGALNSSRLPAKLREQIAILTAEANDCEYCLAAHTVISAKLGVPAQHAADARVGESTDPHTKAALTFARRVLDTRGGVSDADVQSARAAGLTDAELAEVVASVALNVFTNYINRAFDVDLDFPRVKPLATAAAR